MALMIEMFPGHLKAIGIITVRWSSLDGDIYDILKNRLCLPEKAENLRSLNAGVARLNCFRKLLGDTSLPPEEKDPLVGAVDRLLCLWKERNSIAHGQYGIIVGDDGVEPSLSDIKTNAKEPSDHLLEPAPVSEDHLRQHAGDVLEAAKPLRDFLYRRPVTPDSAG